MASVQVDEFVDAQRSLEFLARTFRIYNVILIDRHDVVSLIPHKRFCKHLKYRLKKFSNPHILVIPLEINQ